jgi:ABC-2 type transport system permease protein
VGWIQRIQPFAQNNWHFAVFGLVQVVVLLMLADAIAQRREYGTGLIAERLGAAHAPTWMLQPWTFWGTQLANLYVLWWGGAVLLSVLTLGLAQSINTQFTSSPQLMEVMNVIGGSTNVMRAFYSFMFFFTNVIAMSAGIQCLLVLRRHEQHGLLSAWMAGIWSRRTLYLVALLWAVLVASGVMLIYAVVIGTLADQSMLTIVDALQYVTVTWPAVMCTIALASLLLAWVPRAVGLIWLWVVANSVTVLFNDLWKLSDAVVQFLPLAYSPNVLLGDVVSTYPIVVCVVTLVLYGMAMWGWQRRDIG